MRMRWFTWKRYRGQIFTLDYIISVMVFAAVLLSTLTTWDAVLEYGQQDFAFNEMSYAASRAAKLLVRNPGNPTDWDDDPQDVTAYGLATETGGISQSKIDALETLDDDEDELWDFREHLGTGNYMAYVRVTNSTGYLFGEAGEYPTGDVVVNSREVTYLDGQLVYVDVSVWAEAYITYTANNVLQ